MGGDTLANEEEEERSTILHLPIPEKSPPDKKKVVNASAGGGNTDPKSTKKPTTSNKKGRGGYACWHKHQGCPPPKCHLEIDTLNDDSDMIGLSIVLVETKLAQCSRSCDANRV